MKKRMYNRAMKKTSSVEEFLSCFDEGCDKCSLSHHQEDHLPVVYRGNPNSQLLLIGEAPGLIEQKERLPFVGPAGELLERIIVALDLDIDEDFLLSNCVYCRPTAPPETGRQNYTPTTEQIRECWETFGHRLLELVQPKVIIACGRIALQTLLEDKKLSLKSLEGRWTTYKGRNIFVMTHPASLLHMKNKATTKEYIEKKREVWEYMQYFKKTLPEKLI